MPGDDRRSHRSEKPRVDRDLIQGDAKRALDAAMSEPQSFDLAQEEPSPGAQDPQAQPPKGTRDT